MHVQQAQRDAHLVMELELLFGLVWLPGIVRPQPVHVRVHVHLHVRVSSRVHLHLVAPIHAHACTKSFLKKQDGVCMSVHLRVRACTRAVSNMRVNHGKAEAGIYVRVHAHGATQNLHNAPRT